LEFKIEIKIEIVFIFYFFSNIFVLKKTEGKFGKFLNVTIFIKKSLWSKKSNFITSYC